MTPTPTSGEATEAAPAALPGDGLREAIIEDLRKRIGDALIDTHIVPER